MEAEKKDFTKEQILELEKNPYVIKIGPTGITIGSNTVIGTGSVVTKDIPSNVVAFGNPCKVIKDIE